MLFINVWCNTGSGANRFIQDGGMVQSRIFKCRFDEILNSKINMSRIKLIHIYPYISFKSVILLCMLKENRPQREMIAKNTIKKHCIAFD